MGITLFFNDPLLTISVIWLTLVYSRDKKRGNKSATGIVNNFLTIVC